MLETGDWAGRLRAVHRMMIRAGVPAAPWAAFRVPEFPPLRLPRPGRPAFRLRPVPWPARWAGARRRPSLLLRSHLPRPRPAAVAAALAWALAGIALFTIYLRMSRTVPADSDGASNALQAWAMLHGNPLLRGWDLSDVSFYTTELPQYMLLELLRGLRPDVVHVAGAMTYTLLVLLAAALAKGRRGGLGGAGRAVLAAGIMAAPQHDGGVYVLMLSPDHAGSAVPVLAAWLLLDRAPRRWWVPAAAGLLVCWGLIADSVVLITGAGPLAAVGLVRAYQLVVRRGRPLRAAWFELALAGAAAGAFAAAAWVLRVIGAAGGFHVWPVDNQLAQASELGGNLALEARGVLLLFGANFLGRDVDYVAVLAALHLAGIALACWALCVVTRRFAAADLTAQLLAAGALLSLAAYLLGRSALDLNSTREFVAFLPLSAALAGRVLAARVRAARLTPALALAATGYLLGLARVTSMPPAPAQGSELAAWLPAHHLSYGLAGYWQASAVTLESGGKASVRAVALSGSGLAPSQWEVQPSWYDPARHQASFMVLALSGPGAQPARWAAHAAQAFGQPARVFHVGPYAVLVWSRNLLASLRR